MKEQFEMIQQYMEENEISYKGISHKPAASAEEYKRELESPFEQNAKALLIRYKKEGEKGYVIVTLQAHKQCDMERIQKVLSAKSVRMANLDELKKVTGLNYGEVPPIASIFGIKLVMDRDLLEQETILFNAAVLDYSMRVDPKEIERVEKPITF